MILIYVLSLFGHYVTILKARRFCKMVTLAFSLAVSEIRTRFITSKFVWFQNHLLFGLLTLVIILNSPPVWIAIDANILVIASHVLTVGNGAFFH